MKPDLNQYRIRKREQLQQALHAPTFVLLKHSPRCGTSTWAFREYAAWVQVGETDRGAAAAESAPEHGWLDVVADRPLSAWIAERSGVPHESPQVIVFRNGRPAWNASHFDLSRDHIARAVCEIA